jgi:hypothetical protein
VVKLTFILTLVLRKGGGKVEPLIVPELTQDFRNSNMLERETPRPVTPIPGYQLQKHRSRPGPPSIEVVGTWNSIN